MKLKFDILALFSALVLGFTTSVSAGALSDPIIEAPITVHSEKEWQGFRLGLSYNSEISGNTFATSEGVPFINNGNIGDDNFGAFLGFDWQRGGLVYGVELQSLKRDNTVVGFPARSHKDLHSIRGRIGYAIGKTLVYGTLGYAISEFDDAGTLIDMDGYIAGIGVERKIGDNAFVGLGVDHYQLKGERLANAIEAGHTLVQLRIGFVF